MIKPLNAPQLSSAKPRCGLQRISDLVPRLIRQYEIQAELMKQRNQEMTAATGTTHPVVPGDSDLNHARQCTFNWYQ